MRKALITGLSGPVLTSDEAHFLAAVRPAGLILFARNCLSPDQTRTLVGAALDAIGTDDTLVLIDQEGGRVQRLRPPHWRALPPARAYGRAFAADPEGATDAARLVARLTADDLSGLGINCNCAPVLDVPVPGAHDIIGDRAYATNPAEIIVLAKAQAHGYGDGGVVPVIKHIPGHGRATADSHLELPVVTTPKSELDWTDFSTFWALSEAPTAMTAHVVFTDIDAGAPASTSRIVHDRIIRGEIGFDGLLMSDDLGMRALSGSMADRAAAVIAAGSDLALHCSGTLAEMTEAAAAVPVLDGLAARRFERCLAITRRSEPFDRQAAQAALARILAGDGRSPPRHPPVESV